MHTLDIVEHNGGWLMLIDGMQIPVPEKFQETMKELIQEILEEGRTQEREKITNLITEVAQDYEYSATTQNAIAEIFDNLLQ